MPIFCLTDLKSKSLSKKHLEQFIETVAAFEQHKNNKLGNPPGVKKAYRSVCHYSHNASYRNPVCFNSVFITAVMIVTHHITTRGIKQEILLDASGYNTFSNSPKTTGRK